MRTSPVALFFFCACAAFSFGQASNKLPTASPEPQKLGLSLSSELILSNNSELKGTDADYKRVAIQNLSWALSQAIPLNGNRSATIGLGCDIVHTRVEPPRGFDKDDTWDEFKQTHPNWDRLPVPTWLKALTASFGYAQEIDERWSFSSSLAVGSHVANTGLLSKGWGTSISAMGLYKWDPDFTLALGAAYDSLSSDFRFVPILGFDYQLSDKWTLALGFPSTAISYQMRKSLLMSLELTGSGGTYHVQDDPRLGVAAHSLSNSKLETMEVRLGFKVEWQINDTFAINATSGHVLYREFKYIDRNYKLRSRDVVGFLSVGGSCSF